MVKIPFDLQSRHSLRWSCNRFDCVLPDILVHVHTEKCITLPLILCVCKHACMCVCVFM